MSIRILTTIALAAAAVATSACSHDPTSPSPLLANSASKDSSSTSTGTTGNGYYGQPSTPRIRLIVRLAPPTGGTFSRASGKASWDSRNSNSKRELEMEVEDVSAGTQVNFFVNGVQVGSTATVDVTGHASLHLSTEAGQTVPTAAAGLSAEVRTAAGAVVVTGIFPTS